MEIIFERLIPFLCLIIAITIHEFFHALAADKLGDPTPRSFGRLSLNPLAHADLFGTFLLPLMSTFTGIPTIGWAKPVPIDPYNFRHPKRDEIIVSLAGPLSNLSLAFICSFLIRLFSPLTLAGNIFFYLILINISLFIFNLLPIPPLDGSKVFLNLLPPESYTKWSEAFDRYGIVLLLLFVFLPVSDGRSLINLIMLPAIRFILSLFGLIY
jgi:Zn-dependent protease